MNAVPSDPTRSLAEPGPIFRVAGLQGIEGNEKQVGEHADGSGRVGEERYPLDARLAYRSPPDYLSHSFLGARTTASPHYHSVRASANRYEERYEQELLASLCSGLRKTWLRPGPMG